MTSSKNQNSPIELKIGMETKFDKDEINVSNKNGGGGAKVWS